MNLFIRVQREKERPTHFWESFIRFKDNIEYKKKKFWRRQNQERNTALLIRITRCRVNYLLGPIKKIHNNEST